MIEEFGRGQVEYALWNAFAPPHVKTKEINKTFKARIKRLLELDHLVLKEHSDHSAAQNYAFTAKPDERGVTIKYSGLDAICLGVALELIDLGHTQKQVAMLMQFARRPLANFFKRDLQLGQAKAEISSAALTVDADWLSGARKNKESHGKEAGRAYLVVRAVELTEIDFEEDGVKESDISIPILCRGPQELAEHLSEFKLGEQRSFTIVEVAYLSRRIITMLKNAPKIARGRPPGT